MNVYENSPKIRIIGALMQNFIQKAATLVGELIKVESDGKRATFKTTDDQFVQIVFERPELTQSLRLNTLTELYGIVLSRSQFQCYDIKQWSLELNEEPWKFDRNTYNEFVAEFVKHCDQHFNCEDEFDEDPFDEQPRIKDPIDNFTLPKNFK